MNMQLDRSVGWFVYLFLVFPSHQINTSAGGILYRINRLHSWFALCFWIFPIHLLCFTLISHYSIVFDLITDEWWPRWGKVYERNWKQMNKRKKIDMRAHAYKTNQPINRSIDQTNTQSSIKMARNVCRMVLFDRIEIIFNQIRMFYKNVSFFFLFFN